MTNKLKLLGIIIVTSLFLASGCATIDGAGQDIESAGEEIQDAADS